MATPRDKEGATGTAGASDPAAPREVGGLERVREILFGRPAREIERRLHVIEHRMEQQHAAVLAETRQAEAAFEERVQSTVAALEAAVEDEREARAAALDEASRKAQEALAGLDDRLQATEARLVEASRRADADTREQVRVLREEIARASAQLNEAWRIVFRDLRRDKVDRADLARLFGHLSDTLRRAPDEDEIG